MSLPRVASRPPRVYHPYSSGGRRLPTTPGYNGTANGTAPRYSSSNGLPASPRPPSGPSSVARPGTASSITTDTPSIKMPVPEIDGVRYGAYSSNVSRTPSDRVPRPSSRTPQENGYDLPLAVDDRAVTEAMLPDYLSDLHRNSSTSQTSVSVPASLYPGGSRQYTHFITIHPRGTN